VVLEDDGDCTLVHPDGTSHRIRSDWGKTGDISAVVQDAWTETTVRPEAIDWVRNHADDDQLDADDLRAAFVALIGRQPDENEGIVEQWSACCLEAEAEYGDLRDYETGSYLRPATEAEQKASRDAAESDGGAGVIEVGGRGCYVED
jgi:hypothetical protein